MSSTALLTMSVMSMVRNDVLLAMSVRVSWMSPYHCWSHHRYPYQITGSTSTKNAHT